MEHGFRSVGDGGLVRGLMRWRRGRGRGRGFVVFISREEPWLQAARQASTVISIMSDRCLSLRSAEHITYMQVNRRAIGART